VRIADNAKTQRYGTCNTMETLLVHRGIAPRVLPPLAQDLCSTRASSCAAASAPARSSAMKPATEEDWYTEYLAPILSVRVVDGSTRRSSTSRRTARSTPTPSSPRTTPRARRFLREVDSSSVMVNASTRFADGFEYGLGAEIGISTDKLHARGPGRARGLTSLKYVVLGDGHIRS
jgi:glutamate-5-semialdehyde dehydrogenase